MNITARAKPGHLHACAMALAGVSQVALMTAKSVSPGSEIELRYLSPSQVAAGEQPTVTFSAERVIAHHREKRMLLHGHGADDPKDVMVVLRAAQVNKNETSQ